MRTDRSQDRAKQNPASPPHRFPDCAKLPDWKIQLIEENNLDWADLSGMKLWLRRFSYSHRRQQLVAAIIGVELYATLPLDRSAARGRRSALRDAEGTA